MQNIRVAVLIDLPRETAAGGHVKYWERVAEAAVETNLPMDLTFYFSGTGKDEILSPSIRYRFLPPIFSTAKLKFLPYVPAHTDLAPFHPRLANELSDYDVVHTTDAFFAFARTAERVTKWDGIPLVSSFHTDTPAYAELFTRHTIENIFGKKVGGWLDNLFSISRAERITKERRLRSHLQRSAAIMAMRPEDIHFASSATNALKIKSMRLGVDKNVFVPDSAARDFIHAEYNISPDKFVVLFVGRIDAGKNIPTLLEACINVAAKGIPLHLIVAGQGPMANEVQAKLKEHVTLAGQVDPQKLARLYAAADCLAIASDIEIGGMVSLEALACGCPVLVSSQSGVAQLCGNPDAMQLVETGVQAWTDAIAGLARDMNKQELMRDAALLYRVEHLADWKDVLNDYVPVWQDLAEKK